MLELTGVKKSFGGNHVIPGLDLTLNAGEVTALIGPNGAGKTTIFNLITGFLRPDEGQVVYKGENLHGVTPEGIFRKGLVRTFQEVRVFGGITVLENVLVGREHGFRSWRATKRNTAAAMETLQLVGLDRKVHVMARDLSYAEQKFLSLARVLASDAELLLLDEPTSGLDGRSLDLVTALIPRLHEMGRTVLIIEHNLDVVRSIAERIVFLESGRVIATGTGDELFARQDLADIYFGGGVQ
ncbi:MAG: Amino acid/amide transporter ATP-binding protein 1, family [Frankiales bacterium]|nr:Amino acid/amide transporter ATP-binding protein 1, family [Frankiales bacterium]